MLALLAAVPAAAQEGVPGDPRAGRAVAEQVCAACHQIEAGERTHPGMGAPSFRDVAETEGMTPMALYVWLHSPHPTMPHIRLEREEAEDVVAYIWSLRGLP
jgi:mono/diheme cytochrome c family protein